MDIVARIANDRLSWKVVGEEALQMEICGVPVTDGYIDGGVSIHNQRQCLHTAHMDSRFRGNDRIGEGIG